MIYFVRAGNAGPVKIGYTSHNMWSRLCNLQPGNHLVLRSIRQIPDADERAEKWLHRYFHKRHIRGEWYRFAPEMLTIELPENILPLTYRRPRAA